METYILACGVLIFVAICWGNSTLMSILKQLNENKKEINTNLRDVTGEVFSVGQNLEKVIDKMGTKIEIGLDGIKSDVSDIKYGLK